MGFGEPISRLIKRMRSLRDQISNGSNKKWSCAERDERLLQSRLDFYPACLQGVQQGVSPPFMTFINLRSFLCNAMRIRCWPTRAAFDRLPGTSRRVYTARCMRAHVERERSDSLAVLLSGWTVLQLCYLGRASLKHGEVQTD